MSAPPVITLPMTQQRAREIAAGLHAAFAVA